MQLVECFVQECEQFGVTELFGIPGDFVLPFFQALEQNGTLPLHYLSHEPAAVFAADGAARITNKPSVVILTYGAGALNAVNAVAQAYVEHVPVVVIAGYPSAQEIERGLQIHHQAKHVDSQRSIFTEITATQVRIDQPETAGEKIREAFQTAKEKSRPVLIELPRNATEFQVKAVENYHPKPPNMQHVEHTLAPVITALQKAKRPVILAGVDVRRFTATAELEHLAARLNIPMLSTFMGRASIHQHHPMYRGIFLDKSDQHATQLISEADCILQVGVIRTDSNFAANMALFPEDKVFDLQQHGPELSLCTQLRVLGEMLPLAYTEETMSVCGTQNSVETEVFCASRVAQVVEQIMGKQDQTFPVVSDVGDCLFASLNAYPTLLLAPAFYASMGYAIPAAYGVMAATGMRPLIFVGDGAFLMTGLELGHFTRAGYAPIIVLFNNKKWDMIEAFSPGLGCTKLEHWNYVQLAEAMGGKGVSVSNEDELAQAFDNALMDTTRFTLIEAQLAPNSRTAKLQGFADGFLAAGRC